MIPPAAWQSRKDNAFDGVLEIGREDAERIERKADPCGLAQPWNEQAEHTENFGDARRDHSLARRWHPIRNDRQERRRRTQMQQAGGEIECC